MYFLPRQVARIAVTALAIAASACDRDGQPGGASTDQRAAADDLPRHAADAAGRLADAEPGRQVAALHAVDAGLEGSRSARPTSISCRCSKVVPSTRQMTFTKEKNETSPRWARDGSFFVFLSNREAPESAATRNQLYVMRPDGGEARRITDAKEGVADFAFSRDGRWLAYRSGKSGEEQLYRLPVAGDRRGDGRAESRSTRPASRTWEWAPDSTRIYFVTPDRIDDDEKVRREKKFTVNIRNAETPVASLWALDLDPHDDEAAHRGRRLLRRRLHDLG